MKHRVRIICWMAFLTLSTFSVDGFSDRSNPGSLLLFPYYNTKGDIVICSITNTEKDSIYVRMVWIDENKCDPNDQNYWLHLTGYDTFTFIASYIAPKSERGFMYAYVVDGYGSINEKKANVLTGQEIIITLWDASGIATSSINAPTFQAINPVPDGKLHLDDKEYNVAAKSLYFPRFFGQPKPGQSESFKAKLMLINLTGGKYFEVGVRVYIYNDYEVVFSAYNQFGCCEFIDLLDFSAATSNDFLSYSMHDPSEPVGFSKTVETGWLEITGDYAYNPGNSKMINDPSIYAMLFERYYGVGYGAVLPFQIEDPAVYNNGMLWSADPNGN